MASSCLLRRLSELNYQLQKVSTWLQFLVFSRREQPQLTLIRWCTQTPLHVRAWLPVSSDLRQVDFQIHVLPHLHSTNMMSSSCRCLLIMSMMSLTWESRTKHVDSSVPPPPNSYHRSTNEPKLLNWTGCHGFTVPSFHLLFLVHQSDFYFDSASSHLTPRCSPLSQCFWLCFAPCCLKW